MGNATDNLTLLNETATVNTLFHDELSDFNGLFGMEASMTIGVLAGVVFLILCTIGVCWYYLAKRKSFTPEKII